MRHNENERGELSRPGPWILADAALLGPSLVSDLAAPGVPGLPPAKQSLFVGNALVPAVVDFFFSI